MRSHIKKKTLFRFYLEALRTAYATARALSQSPDSQTQTSPLVLPQQTASRLTPGSPRTPLRKDPRGYFTRQPLDPLTSPIHCFAPVPSYSIFLPIFHHSHSYTGQGWAGAPILLVNTLFARPCTVPHNVTTGLNLILHYISVTGLGFLDL